MTKNDQTALDRKLQRIRELADLIRIHSGQPLTRSQQAEDDDWKSRLAFRLNELVMRSKLEEADIRIKVFEGMLDNLNRKK